jgi:hypothetical protein
MDLKYISWKGNSREWEAKIYSKVSVLEDSPNTVEIMVF